MNIRVWLSEDASSQGVVLAPVGLEGQFLKPGGPREIEASPLNRRVSLSGGSSANPTASHSKALPSVLQTASGILYEEPCVIFIR